MLEMVIDTALAEVPVNSVALIDDTDFKTIEATVAFNAAGMDLVWNFVTEAGVTTQTAVTPTSSGVHDWANAGLAKGMYVIEIPLSGGTINNDTEGYGYFTGVATGILPWRGPTIWLRSADQSHATQSQLNQVANVSGQAKRAPSSYALTTGTQSANTVSSTEELDGTRHEHTSTGNAMDLYYEFDIGSALATEVKFTGYLQGNNDDLEIHGYDWVAAGWKRIGTLAGKASANNEVNSYDLLVDMVGFGANQGKVRIRFTDGAFTLSSATLAIDQLLVVFSIGAGAYENGAIWFDSSASNTNTVRGVDGRASNPVSTMGAVNTLLASANLNRVEVAPNSTVTLATSQDNQQFTGENWTLVFGDQSVSGSHFRGAHASGVATGASEIHFKHMHFANVTLPPCDCENCTLVGTFTFGTAGDFFFEGIRSGIAGTSTPVIDFGAALNASNLNLRDASLGIELKNMGAGTGSYNCSLEGFGQLIINANCSATSTIAIRGHFPVTGDSTAIAAITFSEDARFTRSRITGGDYALNTTNLGNIGIDWGNVENQTSSVGLDSTSVGSVDVVTLLGANSIAVGAFATDSITAAALAADAVTKIQLGLATSSALTTHDGKLDTLLSRIPAALFTGITSVAQWLGLMAGKQAANATALTEIKATGAGSGTFNEADDSLEAIRERGDAAWATASGLTAEEVRIEMDANSTKLASIVEDSGTTLPAEHDVLADAIGDIPAIGAGAVQTTIEVKVKGLPVDGVEVWFSTDLEGLNVVHGTFVTDAFGLADFGAVDTGTYYVHRQKAGLDFTVQTITVS